MKRYTLYQGTCRMDGHVYFETQPEIGDQFLLFTPLNGESTPIEIAVVKETYIICRCLGGNGEGLPILRRHFMIS